MSARLVAVILAQVFAVSASAQQPKGTVKLTDAKVVTSDHVYKKTPEGELTLHGFFPADWKPADQRPVIVSISSWTFFSSSLAQAGSLGLLTLKPPP